MNRQPLAARASPPPRCYHYYLLLRSTCRAIKSGAPVSMSRLVETIVRRLRVSLAGTGMTCSSTSTSLSRCHSRASYRVLRIFSTRRSGGVSKSSSGWTR